MFSFNKLTLLAPVLLAVFVSQSIGVGVGGGGMALAATKTQGDFNLSNRFSFEIDGVRMPAVFEVSGISDSSEVVQQ